MAVKIRFARFGCKHRPFYRVVIADSRSNRDGKNIEVVGYYNPLPGPDETKQMALQYDRIQYWLSVGAQPTDTVERLLFKAGLLPPRPMVVTGSKGDNQLVDRLTGHTWENAEGSGKGDEVTV
ncbi:small ribosomal subunit protein bS16cy-like [Rutidosis leptorrhynchoides]|uniref:small ribosomal subunit protein bS16cy-like n=1 Tax=Rutidosis leptorrhynchoides TaxID=125765 RepID=UPI003A9990A4